MNKLYTLPNRLKIVAAPMPHMESVAIGVLVGMGSRYEEKKVCGVSHFIEHMLFKGTKKRDARKLKEEIEGVGGHFNGFTAEDVTCYLVKIPSAHVKLGLDVLHDMVSNPSMDEREIEKEKFVICEEIKMYKDQPASYVHEILAETMWPEHPLGRPLAGSEETVRGVSREILFDVKERYYRADNMAIVIAGKFIESELLPYCRKIFGRKSDVSNAVYERFSVQQNARAVKLHYKDTEQTHIAIGFHTFGRTSPKRYILNVLNIILGGNMSSRLFEELREKKALCYDVSSSVKKYDDTGAFYIHAGIANEKVAQTLKAMSGELVKIKDQKVSKKELTRAKEFYKGQLLLALEDTGSRMLWLGEKVMTKEGIPPVKDIIKGIDDVSASSVADIANEILSSKRLNIAVIGPERTLKDIDIYNLMEIG